MAGFNLTASGASADGREPMKKIPLDDPETRSADVVAEKLLVGQKVKDDRINAKVAEARKIRLTRNSDLGLCRAAVICQSFLRLTLCQAMNIKN